jgi:hypothetical protein
VDQDAVTPGVQILGGTFLNPAEGTVAVNDADNTAGTVQYAVALKSPAAPVNGSGVLCEITFRALAEGTTDLAFGDVTLADDEAAAIDVTVYDSSAQVSASFSNVYMPLVIKAAPR